MEKRFFKLLRPEKAPGSRETIELLYSVKNKNHFILTKKQVARMKEKKERKDQKKHQGQLRKFCYC